MHCGSKSRCAGPTLSFSGWSTVALRVPLKVTNSSYKRFSNYPPTTTSLISCCAAYFLVLSPLVSALLCAKVMGGSMTKVLPGLYVGGLENAKDAEELIANCISHILVAQNHKYEIEKSASRKYLQIVMLESDDRSLFRRVAESNDFIHQARLESGNVLVCSDSGMSANVTLVAAYLMSVYQLDRSSALSALRGRKHAAHPVPALLAQLDQFDSASSASPENPGSSATSASPRQPLPVVTSMSENLRLTEKFGSWPRLEEDMHLLQSAMNSHKSFTESDFVPYESGDIVETETPPSEDVLHHPSSPPALESFSPVTNNVHWTPPRTPPSTPISSVVPAGEHVTVPLEAIAEIELQINHPGILLKHRNSALRSVSPCGLEPPFHVPCGGLPRNVQIPDYSSTPIAFSTGKAINPTTEPNDENLCGGDQRTPTALVAPESGIFCLDTTEDPLPPPSPEPEPSTWAVITGRMHDPNGTELGIDEVGLEPQAYVSEDGDDDDVPGAITIPASDNRISIAQSHRHGLAASYHAHSSLFDSSRHGSVPGAVARSLAPTGFAKPK
ncbi:hypothetical protein T265_10485 [Opisthorchis viverrini]|uniref:Tyrosine-protein phosphatase domain-containing protein n=1 Tax=Opisthorchis viverrini TaxID=6198 RepID=A0A075A153_OPIVI|nr:hypothetical protein T265_10485 [Opisthorchis viverrini]KER21124.1 hypothetical protein T265_10485 [Opisthorchis viverrini]